MASRAKALPPAGALIPAELEEGPMGFMVEDRHLYAAFLELRKRRRA